MKKIIVTAILILVFALPVCAQENLYQNQLENSGAKELEKILPEGAKDIFDDLEIDIKNPNIADKITVQSIFKIISNFIKNGGKIPARTGLCVLALIIIAAAFSSLGAGGEISETAELACTAAVAVSLLIPVYNFVGSTASAMKGAGVFMTGFVPIFAGIVTMSGAVGTSTVSSVTLLAAAQGLTWFSAFGVVPVMCAYLAVSGCCAVSPLMGKTGISESVKKLAMWVLSLILTVFSGVMSLQTMLSGAADSMALRTGKFLIGSALPLGGSAIGEAVSTLVGSMGVLKNTVGIYAIMAVAVCVIPLCIELLLYRFWLFVSGSAAALFGQTRITSVIKAADSVLSVLVSLILFTAALFIICIIIVVKAGVAA